MIQTENSFKLESGEDIQDIALLLHEWQNRIGPLKGIIIHYGITYKQTAHDMMMTPHLNFKNIDGVKVFRTYDISENEFILVT